MSEHAKCGCGGEGLLDWSVGGWRTWRIICSECCTRTEWVKARHLAWAAWDRAMRRPDPKRPDRCCEDCGATDDSVTWGPCPYAYEMCGDETPMWLCEYCASQRAQDI